MYCPKCDGQTKVINSREAEHENAVKRRHECLSCGYRYNTIERIVENDNRRVSKAGTEDKQRGS